MKFLIDKENTDGGRFLPDWEYDRRLGVLMGKYKFKETVIKNTLMEDIKINTVRISSMKELEQFVKDFGDIKITQDSGYYFNIGCPRIVLLSEKINEEIFKK